MRNWVIYIYRTLFRNTDKLRYYVELIYGYGNHLNLKFKYFQGCGRGEVGLSHKLYNFVMIASQYSVLHSSRYSQRVYDVKDLQALVHILSFCPNMGIKIATYLKMTIILLFSSQAS